MVIVVGKSKEEEKVEERYNKLEGIALKEIKGSTITHYLKPRFFPIYKEDEDVAGVFVEGKIILSINKKYFDETLKLAKAYEKELNEEWTLKKNYNE